MYIHVYVYMYIYIYIYRERERQRRRYTWGPPLATRAPDDPSPARRRRALPRRVDNIISVIQHSTNYIVCTNVY